MTQEITWEDRIAGFAGGYRAGVEVIRARRAVWERCAPIVILPTLERAAEVMKRNGLLNAYARRRTFGRDLESVQLYTGQEDGLAGVLEKGPDGKASMLVEVGATLGYSLGLSGQVLRWVRKHWVQGLGHDHPPWTEIEIHEDADELVQALVERHVLQLLEMVRESSYRQARPADRAGPPIRFSTEESSLAVRAEHEPASIRMGFMGADE
jgi:hypothetical protein